MAKEYRNDYGKYGCTLEVSPTTKCKLTIRKNFCSKYELSFENINEYMDFAEELQSLGHKWMTEEYHDTGSGEFYME